MEKENYVRHVNTWWWGKTVTLIRKDGSVTVELQFDDDYPHVAFVKGLSVFSLKRRKGYGREAMLYCEVMAKMRECRFMQLSVNKDQEWLVKWYSRLGYVTYAEDENEYTMIKTL